MMLTPNEQIISSFQNLNINSGLDYIRMIIAYFFVLHILTLSDKNSKTFDLKTKHGHVPHKKGRYTCPSVSHLWFKYNTKHKNNCSKHRF